ncbi:NUDIX domain-containing protein [Candidatus Pacearchaeota archaeon]|nr:NUDIX domain-containing protein [Candidatus Pacearchaeota archaeon]
MRIRVAAIIIKDKKILLEKEYSGEIFGTPGGAVDKGEENLDALKREIKEELNIEVEKAELYYVRECVHTKFKIPQKEESYIVTFRGVPKPCNEIEEIKWLSKEEIQTEKVIVFDNFKKHLFLQLIKDNLL